MENRETHEQPADLEVFQPTSVELIDPAREQQQPRHRPRLPRRRTKLAVILFIATCISTFLAGSGLFLTIFFPQALVEMANTGELWPRILDGLIYGGAVMLILSAHEMGHYLQSRRYHVPASLPYFIPLPITPLGTMGAVILQGGHVADRKQMFDIAISGPLAGLLFALPITYFGIQHAEIVTVTNSDHVLIFGDPLLMQWMYEWQLGPLAENQHISSPLLFAGWVGIFVTALNLIPIGQLDGGHILYTLIGKWSHRVAMGLIALALGYMVWKQDPSYSLMLILLILIGPKHPPTADDTVPLGPMRIILGWLTLAFIVIGFTPTPIVNM